MRSRFLRRPRSGTKVNDDGRGSNPFSRTPTIAPLFTSIVGRFNSKNQIARGEAINWMVKHLGPVVQPFLADILRGSDREEVARTIFLLLKHGCNSILFLLDGLGSKDPEVRSMCIRSVSSVLRDDQSLKTHAPIVVPQLLFALGDAHSRVVEEAKLLLCRFANASPDAVLANIDPTDPQAQVAIKLVHESVIAVRVFS